MSAMLKSAYSCPSTSRRRDPEADSMNSGGWSYDVRSQLIGTPFGITACPEAHSAWLRGRILTKDASSRSLSAATRAGSTPDPPMAPKPRAETTELPESTELTARDGRVRARSPRPSSTAGHDGTHVRAHAQLAHPHPAHPAPATAPLHRRGCGRALRSAQRRWRAALLGR